MSDNRSHFATWLVSWRLKHGLSQGQLASKLGITQSRVALIETDYRKDNPTGFLKSLRSHLTRSEWKEAKSAMLEQIAEDLEG